MRMFLIVAVLLLGGSTGILAGKVANDAEKKLKIEKALKVKKAVEAPKALLEQPKITIMLGNDMYTTTQSVTIKDRLIIVTSPVSDVIFKSAFECAAK